MKFLAISGSTRRASTNTAMLHSLKAYAGPEVNILVFEGIGTLPIFSQDLEGDNTPAEITAFAKQIADSDGIIIACPEYVHALPGGLKNAIDWLVSRPEIISKPIAIVHGSHRGDDMLSSLRKVLSTVSDRFSHEIFLQIPVLGQTPKDVAQTLAETKNAANIATFLNVFSKYCSAKD